MTEFWGSRFAVTQPWARSEHRAIDTLLKQIDSQWPDSNNLLINLTWFGPQFANDKYKTLLSSGKHYDRLFWLAMADPVCLPEVELANVAEVLQVNETYYLGSFDSSVYNFTFFSFATRDNLPTYCDSDVALTSPSYIYACYNRKPKAHRIRLVESLVQNQLNKFGIVTLGKNDQGYDVGEGIKSDLYLTLNENEDAIAQQGQFRPASAFGIPYDAYTLGSLDVWQQHFLNIVSETEYRNWDNLFVTEKIFKPIIGLRPFVINGQTKMYQWLEQQGFRTFNSWWPHIDLCDCTETTIHQPIVDLVRWLCQMPACEIQQMYSDMLPDLEYNRKRFYKFAQEQHDLSSNLFHVG